ncbi:class I SAM-dependent methyltransferase [Marinifilum sp. JC120]|nr:class I SAM-dependent methyltransferase [Marinifilum sp. JC120]
MFKELMDINSRPLPFEFYTASDLWTDEHIATQMLNYHLHPEIDAASRNSSFISESSEWIITRFDLASGKKVADFGCGPGLYTTAFAQAGANVTGIDFSTNSLAYARKQASNKSLEVDYINADYLEFNTDQRFEFITMIMCDFCALSPAQRRKILHKFHNLLDLDGSVLLDVFSLSAFKNLSEEHTFEPNLMDGFWSVGDYFGFMNRFKYESEKVVLEKYDIIEAERTRTIYNWLQYFSPDDLEAEFLHCGFSKIELLGNVAGNKYQNESNEFAVIAHK